MNGESYSIGTTTPALRATPPVPGGEPQFHNSEILAILIFVSLPIR